jgi:hypothetical protein
MFLCIKQLRITPYANTNTVISFALHYTVQTLQVARPHNVVETAATPVAAAAPPIWQSPVAPPSANALRLKRGRDDNVDKEDDTLHRSIKVFKKARLSSSNSSTEALATSNTAAMQPVAPVALLMFAMDIDVDTTSCSKGKKRARESVSSAVGDKENDVSSAALPTSAAKRGRCAY